MSQYYQATRPNDGSPQALEALLCNQRSHGPEKPGSARRDQRKVCTETKTQHSQKIN